MGIKTLLANISGAPVFSAKARWALLRAAGVSIGRARVMHGLTIGGAPKGLTIGDRVFINAGAALFPTGGITIGDGVSIGPRAMIMTGTHEIGPAEQRASDPTRWSPVRIGKGTWLGAGVVVQPGVTIGDGCVVAAGSVVTKDLEAGGLYAGVPARLVRSL